MSKDEGPSIVGRLAWGVLGAGLAFLVLNVSGWALPMPAVIGISVGFGLVVAIVGPILLDLLNVF